MIGLKLISIYKQGPSKLRGTGNPQNPLIYVLLCTACGPPQIISPQPQKIRFSSAGTRHAVVILILLDLSAAFDTIDHDTLFLRMEEELGITGPALDWFRSYLDEPSVCK